MGGQGGSEAVRSRQVCTCAALCGEFRAVWYGGFVPVRREWCQLPLGGHWCSLGMCRARLGLCDAHGCWAHRRTLARLSSGVMPLRGAGANENDVHDQNLAVEGLILGAAAVRAFGRLGRAAGGCDRPPLQ